MYVSNENPTLVDVYFDDVTMTYTPGNVIQYNEYYPFGLQTSNSWTRTNTSNNYLYNAGNELNKNSGWYEMFYRGYDPALGRMMQVDPYAPMYASQSTYNYALNNPVMFNDPNGGQVDATGYSDAQLRTLYRNSRWQGQAYSSYDNWSQDNVIGASFEGMWNEGAGGGPYSGFWNNVLSLANGLIKYGVESVKFGFKDSGDNNFGFWVDSPYLEYGSNGTVVGGGVQTNFVGIYTQGGKPWDLDGNGKFSLNEANNWFRNGKGETVQVYLSSIDFSNVFKSDIEKNNGYVNLFFKQSLVSQFFDGGGNVYGTIKLEIVDGLTIKAPGGYFDKYDFDIKSWNIDPERFLRNTATYIGAAVAGDGTPFKIQFLGTATLSGYKPYPAR